MSRSKLLLLLISHLSIGVLKAQKIDSIYVHLYTDSLKKGTYNYINIDGLLSTGKYMPLDSNQLIFSASHGRFTGNNFWIDAGFRDDKISIHVALKKNTALYKDFVMFVKKNEDGPLKTQEQILEEIKRGNKKKVNNSD